MPSLQDFLNIQDLTNAEFVTGAQLNQILTTGTPFGDKGLIMETTDASLGSPNVPDPTVSGYSKWNLYLWRRVQPATALVTFYYWNPNGGSVATYAKWQPLFSGAIANQSITGAMIALATSGQGITDANIASVNASKVVGSLPISGVAGGGLTGNYPNPTVAPNTLNSTMYMTGDANGVQDAQIQSIGAGAGAGINPVGAQGKIKLGPASNILIMNTGGTLWTELMDYFAQLSQASGLGAAGAIPQVNAGGTALQWSAIGTAGQTPQVNGGATGFSWINGLGAPYVSSTSIPPANATPPFQSFGAYQIVFAHGLGVIPKFVRVVLACITNDTATGYQVGDEIDAVAGLYSYNTSTNAAASVLNITPVSIASNAADVLVSYNFNHSGSGLSLSVLLAIKAGGGAPVVPTSWNNFCVKCYAIA
jgi:hypothetical protein